MNRFHIDRGVADKATTRGSVPTPANPDLQRTEQRYAVVVVLLSLAFAFWLEMARRVRVGMPGDAPLATLALSDDAEDDAPADRPN